LLESASYEAFVMQLLQQAYGPAEPPSSKACTTRTWANSGTLLHLKVSQAADLRAPEYCALLAAAGLSFDEFRHTVSKVEVHHPPKRPRPRWTITIEGARKEFERLQTRSPGLAAEMLRRTSPKLFWLLRLHDDALLRKHGYFYLQPIPDIATDRTTIESKSKVGRCNPGCGFWIRAWLRDQAWLQAHTQAQPRTTTANQANAKRTRHDRTMALSRAMFTLLRLEGRPSRVHAGLLAKMVGITMHQAQHSIATTPALKALMAAINGGKNRRLAFWAARGAFSKGLYPSAHDVLKIAGLEDNRINRQLSLEAIACFAAHTGVLQKN
ncbi:hypothetical protein WDZ92_39125, partial [Nostoc sp. NIES-2111]